jgi:uncharacterized protein (DUF362 family)
MQLDPQNVYCARVPGAAYDALPDVHPPECNANLPVSSALVALRTLLADAGLDADRFDTSKWNPLGSLIKPDARVVIKPNWVLHENKSGDTMDCMVTHPQVLEAILHYVVKAKPQQIVIGDAPVQGCDFDTLRRICDLDAMVARFAAAGPALEIKDFRRTILSDRKVGGRARENLRPVDDYLLFDLGTESVLEPITTDENRFRVTMYNPDLLGRNHAPGRHRYLIARDILEADVVVNAPKLKTHRKACITGALKNLVGINGNKEFLPHHRKGGSQTGGDCYAGRWRTKACVEDLLDVANRSGRTLTRRTYARTAHGMAVLARLLGADANFEGSWYGNDTVWRMCHDLQRILHYGRADGTLADTPQRTVLSITDAIVAGQGEGPLAPTACPLGLMTLGTSTAALEWTHAWLMGFDPSAIPITREAFAPHRLPLATFEPARIRLCLDGDPVEPEALFERCGRPFRPPAGWKGHCERRPAGVSAVS